MQWSALAGHSIVADASEQAVDASKVDRDLRKELAKGFLGGTYLGWTLTYTVTNSASALDSLPGGLCFGCLGAVAWMGLQELRGTRWVSGEASLRLSPALHAAMRRPLSDAELAAVATVVPAYRALQEEWAAPKVRSESRWGGQAQRLKAYMTVGVADEHSEGGAGNFTRRVMQNWAHRLHRFGSPSHAAAVLEHVPIDMRTTTEADFLRVLEIVRFGALARASADAVAAAAAIEPGSAADLKAVADAKAAGAPAEGTRRIVLTAVQLNRTFYVQQYTVVTPEPGTHLTRRDTTLWTDTENHDMPIRVGAGRGQSWGSG